MAQAESEIHLEFSGGLVTAVHETRLRPDEIAAGSNWTALGGVPRLDQRYIAAIAGGADLTARGSGWGRYADDEQYAVVNLHTNAVPGDPRPDRVRMEIVDLSQDPLVYTPVTGAQDLEDAQWYFQQFGQYLYAVASGGGFYRKKIAAGTNGTGDFSVIKPPSRPTSAPSGSFNSPAFVQTTFVSSTIVASGSASTALANESWLVTYTTAGNYAITITYASASKPDWEYRDIVIVPMVLGVGVTPPTMTVMQGSASTEAILWWTSYDQPTGKTYVAYRLQNIARSNRSAVTDLKFNVSMPVNGGFIRIPSPAGWGVWMSVDLNTNPGSGVPTFQPFAYECTYYDATTGLESKPSPQTLVSAASQYQNGQWINLTAATTGHGGVTHVRFYRVVTVAGRTVRYRLAEKPNSGNPAWTDKLSVSELADLPIFTPSALTGEGLVALAAWQGRMVLVSEEGLVQISRDQDPLVYEELTGAFDVYDPARGLTFYPDDRQAEIPYGVVAADDLYIPTPYSVRCLVGNSPDNWRLIKLAGIEGAVGPRAFCAYKHGILVLTPSGRLLYHHSALPEPVEVGEKLYPRPGAEGLAEIANSGAVVAVRPDGQVEVRDQTGTYFVMGLDGGWRKGLHTHPTHSPLFISGLALRWLGLNGSLYQGGVDAYVTDGGTTATNGTPVTAWVRTGKNRIGRSSVKSVFLGDTPEGIMDTGPGGSSQVEFPRVTIIGERGRKTYKRKQGKKHAPIPVVNSGWALQFEIEMNKDTPLEECRLRVVPLSEGEHR